MSILMIGGFVAALAFFLLCYHRSYAKRINQALTQEHVKKMPETRLLLFMLMVGLTMMTAVYNVLPLLREPDLDVDEIVLTDAVTSIAQTNDMSYFKVFDQKMVDGGTIVVYSNNQLVCYGMIGTTCQNDQHSTSQIVFYDGLGQIVWQLRSSSLDTYDSPFEDLLFDARAVDRLADGRFVAFGMMVNRTTKKFGFGLLVVDSDGTIVNTVDLDLSSYGIAQYGGHRYFELVGTDDGGFVMQYKELFDGSFVAKFDSLLQEEWHQSVAEPLQSGVYSGTYVGKYAETLLHESGWTYVLNNQEVRAIDPTGTPQWSYSFYGHEYSGFRMADGKLYILGTQSYQVLQGKNLLALSKIRNRMTQLNVEVLDPIVGHLVMRSTFLYDTFAWMSDQVELSPRDVLVDQDGAMTLIAVDVERRSPSIDKTLIALIRFDADGDYQGMQLLEDAFLRSADANRWEETFQKASYALVDGILAIDSPTLTVRRTVTWTNLVFDVDFKHDFDIAFYESTLEIQVALNQTMLILWSLFLLGTIGFRIRDEVRQERELRFETSSSD